MTDHYCDDLFACEHDKLIFPYSRLVCDVERLRNDEYEPMVDRGMRFAYTHFRDEPCRMRWMTEL